MQNTKKHDSVQLISDNKDDMTEEETVSILFLIEVSWRSKLKDLIYIKFWIQSSFAVSAFVMSPNTQNKDLLIQEINHIEQDMMINIKNTEMIMIVWNDKLG